MDDSRTSTATLATPVAMHSNLAADYHSGTGQDKDLILRILVSLATYNERDNLASLIHEIHAVVPRADILVIDDN